MRYMLTRFMSQGLGMMTSVVVPVFDSNDTVSALRILVTCRLRARRDAF